MEENLAQLQAKFEADGGFAERLFSVETPEEVQSLLKEQGLEFSLEEIDTLRDALLKSLGKVGENGELSDEYLADVAGGSVASGLVQIIQSMNTAFSGVKEIFRRW